LPVPAPAGQADAVVVGDDDLLTLNPFEWIAVLPPAAILRMLQSQSQE
jgi:predicted nucleic acid-binding protein